MLDDPEQSYGGDDDDEVEIDGIHLPRDTFADYLSRIDPETLDDKAYFKYIGDVNTEYAQAQERLQKATVAFGQMLTEQIAREVEKEYPNAAYLSVGVLETFYVDEFGNRDDRGTVNDPVFAAHEVLDVNRQPLGTLSSYSPVHFYIERIGEVLDVEPCRLNIHLREWTYPHGDDSTDSSLRFTGEDIDDDPLGKHFT